MAEQRVTDEQLAKLARQPWLAYQSDTVLELIANLRASRAREAELSAELARYKAAVADAHTIMDAAIVRGGYREGQEQRVAELLGIPVGD